MKCPGQDSRYWTGDPVVETPCPECGATVEIFRDESAGRCRRCGHRFLNPGANFGCAQWCSLAKECVGFIPRPAASDPECPMPGPQDNLKRAEALAYVALGGQTAEQLLWLGAQGAAVAWRLPVLDDTLAVDLSARRVTTSAGREVGPAWRILVLHYLALAGRPEKLAPEVTFADLAAARTYAGVYQQRAIARLCATAGRDARPLRAAAVALGGRPAAGGDAAFDFDMFPRVCVRLIWHAADEEFPPSATLLLPANIDAFFCIEDIVVLSERLVARLGGRGF
ncbi:MAG: DUF3786 domain-containing protein [Thermoguttaceae bacterium]|jgi:hypothetical protein